MALELSDHIKDTHLKSMLDVVLEQSKKKLTTMRSELAENPEALSVKERDFLFKECAKLENLGNLQTSLDEYRERHSRSKPNDKAVEADRKDNSSKLGRYLRAIGQFKPGLRWEAHHIVCSRHSSHASARLMLFAYMGINDPHNGCWLPKKHADAKGSSFPDAVGHRYVHTNDYARWVGRMLRPARNKAGMINRLNDLRLKLQAGKRHTDVVKLLTPKGKADLFPGLSGKR